MTFLFYVCRNKELNIIYIKQQAIITIITCNNSTLKRILYIHLMYFELSAVDIRLKVSLAVLGSTHVLGVSRLL